LHVKQEAQVGVYEFLYAFVPKKRVVLGAGDEGAGVVVGCVAFFSAGRGVFAVLEHAGVVVSTFKKSNFMGG
jgi:hypothetical protein